MNRSRLLCLALLLLVAGCAAPLASPSTQAAQSAPAIEDVHDWQQTAAPLGGRQELRDGVWCVAIPRSDLIARDAMAPIPVAAGLESHVYFYRCTCGLTRMNGDILARADEVDDVIDALRAGRIAVVSIAPMFDRVKPELRSIRFQGEGTAPNLVQIVRAALDQIGHPELKPLP